MSDKKVRQDCEACPKQAFARKRTVMPSMAITRENVYTLPLMVSLDKQNAVEFKCAQQKNIGSMVSKYEERTSSKAGIVGSDSPITQGIEAAVSSILPGDVSALKNPIRSAAWRLLTPGGRNIPNPLARAAATVLPKPERGYRCPEGFQFGGRFTDKYYSTCGRQLFELAMSIASGLASVGELASAQISRPLSIYGREIKPLPVSGQVTMTRKPNVLIPKVSSMNFKAYTTALQNVVKEMTDFDGSLARLVRRDGVVLTPLVSAKVLRTVPDNRDMEDAAYLTKVVSPSEIGKEELGVFSNTGVNSILYVLPDGSTLSLRKKRNLTPGERRKLGKVGAEAQRMKSSWDIAAKIEHVASEMEGAIAYEQKFPLIKGPNDIVTVTLPGTKTKRQMRRWHYEAFYRDSDKKPSIDIETPTQVEDESGFVDSLKEAVAMLDSGGQLGNVKPAIRATALEKSNLSETRKLNSKIKIHEFARQKFLEISSSNDFEHIGAMFAAEVQYQLGMAAPDVWFAGQGRRRPYIVSYPSDAVTGSRIARSAGLDLANPEDMARLLVADILTDARNRNPSGIYSVKQGQLVRTFSSPLSTVALVGLSRKQASDRLNMRIADFLQEPDKMTYAEFFKKLKKEQRKKAIALLEELLDRAKNFNFSDFSRRIAIDGEMSEAEKRHLEIVRQLFVSRVKRLGASLGLMKRMLGEVDE